jgi:hypothetical protein
MSRRIATPTSLFLFVRQPATVIAPYRPPGEAMAPRAQALALGRGQSIHPPQTEHFMK